MTNKKSKLNGLLKAFLPLLALLIICTITASIPINAEEDIHQDSGNGTCTNCGEKSFCVETCRKEEAK